VGIVVDVLKMPAQNVFVIDAEGKEILIPDVDAFIKTIDINNGIIVIDPIEGLLN
jgi:16S rRNA processing protein RimM